MLGFIASTGDRDLLTVETSRGAEQTISTTKYDVTGRGGKGRELLQRGQFTRVIVPMPEAPQPSANNTNAQRPTPYSQTGGSNESRLPGSCELQAAIPRGAKWIPSFRTSGTPFARSPPARLRGGGRAVARLGIGGNSLIYGLVDGYVLHPFPYPEPDRLLSVGVGFPKVSSEIGYVEVLSPAEYTDIRAARSFAATAAFDLGNRNISGGDVPERVFTALLLDDLFPVIGMRAAARPRLHDARSWRRTVRVSRSSATGSGTAALAAIPAFSTGRSDRRPAGRRSWASCRPACS